MRHHPVCSPALLPARLPPALRAAALCQMCCCMLLQWLLLPAAGSSVRPSSPVQAPLIRRACAWAACRQLCSPVHGGKAAAALRGVLPQALHHPCDLAFVWGDLGQAGTFSEGLKRWKTGFCSRSATKAGRPEVLRSLHLRGQSAFELRQGMPHRSSAGHLKTCRPTLCCRLRAQVRLSRSGAGSAS